MKWSEWGLPVQLGDAVAGSWYSWNPLTDDGDALRLAVKLSLNLYLSDAGQIDVDGADSVTEDFGTGDPYAATRRAIVRAAASLAQQKEQT